MTPREKFVGLIKNDILRMDLAELDFGIYRILNHRRRAVTQYLENTLPNRIEASIAKLEGAAVNEEERIFAQLHTFFTRYYEDGDFVMKARRGRNAAYSVPYNGEDMHFHWDQGPKGTHTAMIEARTHGRTFVRLAQALYTMIEGSSITQSIFPPCSIN